MRKTLLFLCIAATALGQKETKEKNLPDYETRASATSAGVQSSALTADLHKTSAANYARAAFGSESHGVQVSLVSCI